MKCTLGDISLGMATDFGTQIDAEFKEIDDSGAKSSLMEVRTHTNGPCTRYRGKTTRMYF